MPLSSIQKRSNTCHSAPNDYYPNYPHSRVLSWHFVFGVFSVPHVYRSFCVLNGGKNASAFIDPFYYSNCWLFCTNIQQKRQKKKSDLISLLLNTWTLYIHLFRLCARWWYLHKLIPKIKLQWKFFIIHLLNVMLS